MRSHRLAARLVLATTVALASGCGKAVELLRPNQPPRVTLDGPQVVATTTDGRTYRLRWSGEDADGRIDHYEYALDPAAQVDAAWQLTSATEHRLTIEKPLPGRTGREAERMHLFLVRSVDDRGARSEPACVALAADNLPPVVTLTNPRPTSYKAFAGPSFRVVWEGVDPDGQTTTRPVRYKFRLIPDTDPDFRLILENPDSLQRRDAPAFASWDSSSAESTSVRYEHVPVSDGHYEFVFVVTGFDEAGDYDPIFSRSKNFVVIRVTTTSILSPHITLFADNFYYSYVEGGDDPKDRTRIPVEFAPGIPVTIHWTVRPSALATEPLEYRWVLDPVSLEDETPRSDEQTDWRHWSAWSRDVLSATIGPFDPLHPPKRERHAFYMQARDDNGRSLGIVDLVVVPPTLTDELLIVDDTRFIPDQFRDGVLQPPVGPWPTAAELDTFLFARGGFPWRGYPGTVSRPGLFAGYAFDTVGTRFLRTAPLPLSTLAAYRHVVWLVDQYGAWHGQPLTDLITPSTMLRWMASPGNSNTLATYARMGGKLWLAGGGAALAVSLPFNDPSNDRPTTTFSSSRPSELGPGRFMFDLAKWQSEFRVYKTNAHIESYTGRFRYDPTAHSGLPRALEPKTPATDPLEQEAPGRTAATFYQTGIGIEFLELPNQVVEDVQGIPTSTLDSLYFVYSNTLPDSFVFQRTDSAFYATHSPRYVVMTSYRSPDPQGPMLVMTGFPILAFQRAQCRQLVDFVLQRMWGITKSEAAAGIRAEVRESAPRIRKPTATGVLHGPAR